MASILDRKRLQVSPMDGFTVRLTAWHQIRAREIGYGNMGEGLRIALEMYVRAKSINEQAIARIERRKIERRSITIPKK